MYIYIIREEDTHYYKVGKGISVIKRCRFLQIGNPHNLLPRFRLRTDTDSSVEKAVHLKYKDSCVRGEWFIFTDTQLDKVIDFIYSYIAKENEKFRQERYNSVREIGDYLIS